MSTAPARAARSAVHATFGRIASGRLEIHESFSGQTRTFGPRDARLAARVEVHSPGLYPGLVRGRSVGLGKAYADGLWDCDDLVALFRIGALEMARLDPLRRRLAPVARPFHRLATLPLLNTRHGARGNIAAHYDLGNTLFETFLDAETMMYSSACFEHEGQSLADAQLNKLERICRRLDLGPGDHLVEIGTGWGGLAVHAAANFGCRVTTTTISREQRSYAEARVRAAGLEDLVRVIGADYRDLEGRFTKLASIEMIEAVGWEYFDAFFTRCSALLAPDGLMFLQAICTDDRAFEIEKSTRSFSNQLIFPGGCLPSVERIGRSLAAVTDMRSVWLEDISSSYALTIAEWRRRFLAAAPQLSEAGYDRRFRRLWEMYLSISEAGFREARIVDVQMLIAKPRWTGRVPSRPPSQLVGDRASEGRLD
jgi:cyclopropane-fatty-acyl-phospholipid synthase